MSVAAGSAISSELDLIARGGSDFGDRLNQFYKAKNDAAAAIKELDLGKSAAEAMAEAEAARKKADGLLQSARSKASEMLASATQKAKEAEDQAVVVIGNSQLNASNIASKAQAEADAILNEIKDKRDETNRANRDAKTALAQAQAERENAASANAEADKRLRLATEIHAAVAKTAQELGGILARSGGKS